MSTLNERLLIGGNPDGMSPFLLFTHMLISLVPLVHLMDELQQL